MNPPGPLAPFTEFGETRLIPITLYVNARPVPYTGQAWDNTLWVERGEDWYAFSNQQYRDRVIRVVTRELWLASPSESR